MAKKNLGLSEELVKMHRVADCRGRATGVLMNGVRAGGV